MVRRHEAPVDRRAGLVDGVVEADVGRDTGATPSARAAPRSRRTPRRAPGGRTRARSRKYDRLERRKSPRRRRKPRGCRGATVSPASISGPPHRAPAPRGMAADHREARAEDAGQRVGVAARSERDDIARGEDGTRSPWRGCASPRSSSRRSDHTKTAAQGTARRAGRDSRCDRRTASSGGSRAMPKFCAMSVDVG